MREHFVAGIDYATTRIDVVLLPWEEENDQDRPRWTHIELRGIGAKESLRWFYACVRVPQGLSGLIDWRLVDMCAIEQPVGPGSRRLLPLMGAIAHAIPAASAPAPILPQEWKLLFCDNGHATKEEVADRALSLGFPRDWSQDAYDALGIAWAWRMRAHGAVELAEARNPS